MNKKIPTKMLVMTGLIAALYVVFTLPFGQVAFGPIQFRIAEVLTLLPFFTPWAIPGVTLGCLISNLLFSTPWDALFGTIATLIAAYFTYRSKHLLVAPLWPILFNGLIIGTMLTFMINGNFAWLPWLTMMAEVTLSEFVVCFAIGVPFMRIFQRYDLQRIFK
ncbi:MAG: QueT transporter family protein [Clostridia bacterium]|nr:QueT transporter family protein [Clostridia bacterium]